MWSLDDSGNYLSDPTGAVSGASSLLESFEPSFQQDLNGDGQIGILDFTDPNDKPQFIYADPDTNGVQLYDGEWNILGSHPFAVRVLAPNDPSMSYTHSFLFVLPVEGGLAQAGFGDGLDQLQQLKINITRLSLNQPSLLTPGMRIIPMIRPWIMRRSLGRSCPRG